MSKKIGDNVESITRELESTKKKKNHTYKKTHTNDYSRTIKIQYITADWT